MKKKFDSQGIMLLALRNPSLTKQNLFGGYECSTNSTMTNEIPYAVSLIVIIIVFIALSISLGIFVFKKMLTVKENSPNEIKSTDDDQIYDELYAEGFPKRGVNRPIGPANRFVS